MTMVFKWDQRSMHRFRATRTQGIEIHRGCLVTGIPLVDTVETGTDPEVFIKVLSDPDCPKIGAAVYPSTVYPFNQALLEEVNPESSQGMGNNQGRFDFVYKTILPSDGNAGSPVWTVTEGGQSNYVEVSATSAGGAALTVWYHKGEAAGTNVLPAGTPDNPARLKGVRGIHKFYPTRTLRVTSQILRADWLAIRSAIRAAAGHINSDDWGSDTRGQWLFMFPIARTVDYGKSYSIELDFLYEKNGHFPIGLFYDDHGDHPSDCATEADIRGVALPPENTYIGKNGIMMASVQPEVAFTPLFAFTPDD